MNPTSPIRPTSTEHKSALAQAIEADNANRPCKVFPVSGFFHLGGKPVHKVAIRVNVKAEEDIALVRAHQYVKDLCGNVESAKSDHDILSDAKARHALFEAVREVKTTVDAEGNEADEVTQWPGLVSPEWMAKNLTTDQIGTLLNLYMQTRAEQSGWFDNFDPEMVDSMLSVAADAQDNPIARVMLAQLPREQIQNLFEIAARRLRDVTRERDYLKNTPIEPPKDAA